MNVTKSRHSNDFIDQVCFLIDNFHLVLKKIWIIEKIFVLESIENEFSPELISKCKDNLLRNQKTTLIETLGSLRNCTILSNDRIEVNDRLLLIAQECKGKTMSTLLFQMFLIDKRNKHVIVHLFCEDRSNVFSLKHIDNEPIVFETDQFNGLVNEKFAKKVCNILDVDKERSYVQSLRCICIQNYSLLYIQLKNKHSEFLFSIWEGSTDPEKFIYEEIAIATYLIVLWQSETKKPSFVDFGCGNGVLVYLLVKEGFHGYGIDVRKRKIWDSYLANVQLKIQTINPSEVTLDQDIDWIIGNHSDELTPWIPVIGAKSARKTNIFVLPCCCYDFNGTKFQRKHTNVSQYTEYLQYIANIAKICGYRSIEIDKLRIPSTKRTCIIGRDCSQANRNAIDSLVDEKLTGAIKLRESTEAILNCSQIDRIVATQIARKIFHYLLNLTNCELVANWWNKGGKTDFRTIIELLDDREKRELANQNGGLKTLLKNFHPVFSIEKNSISIRVPQKSDRSNTKNYKSKTCWFFGHHPNGCFLSEQFCAYKHS